MSAHLSPADTGRSRFTSWLPGKPLGMRDVLLIVDVLDDFAHEHGEELLSSFAETQPALVELLESVRRAELPIVFANDNKGVWDGDVNGIVQRAFNGKGGQLVRSVSPRRGERFVVKPRYSAFDHTPLELILEALECQRLLLAGMTTEGCCPKRRSTRGRLVSRSPSSRRRARR
ncbi:MAG: cysteine hydrolase [Actinobacteria bacterium]|nr:cysteine hydrolase [Actinomycetota bacterium]